MGDPVTWFDLGASDEEPLTSFYGDLFGWTLVPRPRNYTMLATGGGIEGGIGRSQSGEPWIAFYVDVADTQATLDTAVAMGATVVVPATEIPAVTYAMVIDPDGLLIGITKATPEGVSTPPGTRHQGPAVDWFEVMGTDSERSQAFYAELFGWTYDLSMAPYALVDTGSDRGIQGAIGTGGDGMRWATVCAGVDDVGRYLDRAEELGGTRVYGPMDVDDHMQTGALLDPAGNPFSLYHHQPH